MNCLLRLIVLLVIAAPAAAAPGDEIYARPGLVAPTRDGARLNFVCIGQGSPVVVFDSGFFDWAPSWAVVQPRIGQFTRACSYDRAGSGFSDAGPMPVTFERIATQLHDALHSANIKGPYVLVGHASGGTHVRAFADLFPKDVAGLVMVEADAADVDTPENRKKDDEGILGFIPLATACLNAVKAGRPDPTFTSDLGQPPTRCAELFFRGLPEKEWSEALNTKLMDIAGHKVAMWDAGISEAAQIPAGEIWLQEHRRTLGNTPIRILTTGNHGVHFLDKPATPTIEHLKYEYDRAIAQSRWLTLSTNAKQIFVRGSGEYVQFDRPDAVVAAVKEVVDLARR